MILVYYRTVLRSTDFAADHDEMTRRTDAVAEKVPGFLGAQRFQVSPLETIGLMRFADEDAVTAWREHPEHKLAHNRGVDELYSTYKVEIYHLARQAGFGLGASS